jgi:Flp pilus assembly protein TadD
MTFCLSLLLFTTQGYIGSKACAQCHSGIAKSYALTAMAQASGRAGDLRLPNGEVRAAKAGVTYSISWLAGNPQLQFHKRLPDGTIIEGAKKLAYYIGSGSHGRGFIFEEQGQPFQSPLAYFGAARGWDVAPGYENETSIFLGRKVETVCLNCHASGPATSSSLFLEGAVSCERCHGPGESHVAAVQSGKAKELKIVNPRKLAPQQRDSVCADCHLTGETRVVKAGHSETSFRPGDLLGQHVVPFVFSTPDKAELKVVGHFEGLWQSKCKRVSGDKLSCLTCHDPHSNLADGEKVSYYRKKCLGCHEQASCKLPVKERNLEGDSCIACHMQKRASTDGQHTAFTDHAIRRNAIAAPPPSGHSEELVAFWPADATDRDYALAYADQSWQHPDAASIKQAHDRLQAVWPHSPGDAAVAAQLAYTCDLIGDHDTAEALYLQALRDDPQNLIALTNLGTHRARRGQIRRAIDLWRKALAINPGLPVPGLNWARAEQMQGNNQQSLETVRRVLSLNPDSEAALKLERELTH